MADLIGQTIGQYQITALLGKGGMAAVYRARQTKVERDVAIKIIKADLAESPDFLRRFEREAKTIASLSHPNIVKLFDYGEQDGTVYLVMELMTGGTLDKLIRGKGLSTDLTIHQLEQIAYALDYAHSKGVIHRDLKPQNVLLDERNNAYLTDFGIARLAGATSLTQSGAMMGTPFYMSPEQWSGAAIDARSDIYALGIMTYEMLTGIVPFTGDTPLTIMYHHLHDNPPALRIQNPELPAALDDVIGKAVAKEPGARFQSAGAMAEAVQRALSNSDIVLSGRAAPRNEELIPTFRTLNTPTVDPSAPARKSAATGPALLVAGVVVLLLVVAGIVLVPGLLRRPAPTPTDIAAALSPVTAVLAAQLPSTETPTLSPTVNTVSLTQTSDAQAAETLAAGQTATATFWTKTPAVTDTPTVDVVATLHEVLHAETASAQAVLNETATAILWTKTSTATYTPSLTATNTPSPSPTSTPSVAPTATLIQIISLPPTPTFEPGLYPLRVYNPGNPDALDALRNVWYYVAFRDSYFPSTQTYTVTVQNRPLGFSFYQCGYTAEEIQAIRNTITVAFAVNDMLVPDDDVLVYEHTDNGEMCRRWGIALDGWQSGSTLTLEVRYFINKDLSVEGLVYKAGNYRHILQTRVR